MTRQPGKIGECHHSIEQTFDVQEEAKNSAHIVDASIECERAAAPRCNKGRNANPLRYTLPLSSEWRNRQTR